MAPLLTATVITAETKKPDRIIEALSSAKFHDARPVAVGLPHSPGDDQWATGVDDSRVSCRELLCGARMPVFAMIVAKVRAYPARRILMKRTDAPARATPAAKSVGLLLGRGRFTSHVEVRHAVDDCNAADNPAVFIDNFAGEIAGHSDLATTTQPAKIAERCAGHVDGHEFGRLDAVGV